MSERTKKLRWFIPLAIWLTLFIYMAFLFNLSSAPLEDQGGVVKTVHEEFKETGTNWAPVIEHILAYGGLGALALAAWSSLRFLPLKEGTVRRMSISAWKWSIPLALFIAIGYGLFDEWHQSIVPSRSASFEDVGWNVLGVLIGVSIAVYWRSKIISKHRGWL